MFYRTRERSTPIEAAQYAQVQLNYCHIVAPIDGRIGIRLVDSGNLVTADATTSLLVITQVRPITVVFTLAEDSLSQVFRHMSGGKPLTVEVYDKEQETLLGTGRLSTIGNQIDGTTGTVKLRANVDNSSNLFFPISSSIRARWLQLLMNRYSFRRS